MTFTPEEVIEMAKEAGFANAVWPTQFVSPFERFAILVAARQRNAILTIIEELDEPPYIGYENPNTWDDALIALSALIRAQGDQEST